MTFGWDEATLLMGGQACVFYGAAEFSRDTDLAIHFRNLEHNGSVATLEDWFDSRRLNDDYVPTGFKGAGVKSRAVKGHAFGLDLSVAERRALIAFLKTL